MSLPEVRPTAQRRRTTSESRIIAATAHLLESHRVNDVSVEQVLAGSDVSRSTFYQHFSGKSDLVLRLAGPAMDATRSVADLWWKAPAWESITEHARIIELLIETTRRDRMVWLALSDIADVDPEVAAVVGTKIRDYAGQMAVRIRREQADGKVPGEISAPHVARMILVSTRACVLDHLEHGDPADDGTVAATLGRSFWLALYGTPVRRGDQPTRPR